MIFFAVAGPTPGRASSSFSDAVFRSTFVEDGAAADVPAVAGFSAAAGFSEAAAFSFFAGFSDFSAAGSEDFAAPALGLDTVTREEILSIVLADTPAFERSATDEYGRPSMIFLAVASPTPGNASSSCWVAVFRSTFLLLAASADAAGRASVRTRSAASFRVRIFHTDMACAPFRGRASLQRD